MRIEDIACGRGVSAPGFADLWERATRSDEGCEPLGARIEVRSDGTVVLPDSAQLAVATDDDGRAVGIVGAEAGRLAALLVDGACRHRGIDSALLRHAVSVWDVHRADARADDRAAHALYEEEGFSVAYRSSCDGEGRPIPTLHLRRDAGIRADLVSGCWFESEDPALHLDRMRARRLIREFNEHLYYDGSRHEQARLLRVLLGAFGQHSSLTPDVRIDYGYNLFIGDGCFFNYDCTLLDGAPIVFGDDVWVGPGCRFVTPLHPLVGAERRFIEGPRGGMHLYERNLPISVGDRVWIAAGVTVNPGVSIGRDSVIGSGSVVTRDVPEGVVACGVPCRPIREITDEDRIDPADIKVR